MHNKTVVNVLGYVKLINFVNSVNGDILPYVAKDDEGYYVVNYYGNTVRVGNENVEVLK